ncbi:MAG TPA: hypothetical protein VH621_01710 [Nitrososphaera sp.]
MTTPRLLLKTGLIALCTLFISGFTIPAATFEDSILLSLEENAKFKVYESHYDPKLRRDVGIIVSRVIIENETAQAVEGYLGDSVGSRLWMVDNVQVVLAKFVFNNTGTTRWELADWLHDGYFTIKKPDMPNHPDIVAVRIYIGPNSYSVDQGTPRIPQSWVFINPAWTEYAFSSNARMAQSASASDTMLQDTYDPRTYEPRHCTYLVDLNDVYNHCSKLYVKAERNGVPKASSEVPAVEPRVNLSNSTSLPARNETLYQPPSAVNPAELVPKFECQTNSGVPFGIGMNLMTCSAVDASGEVKVRDLEINVINATATEPAVTDDDHAFFAAGEATETITFSINATDMADPAISVTCYMPERIVFSGGFVPLLITALDCNLSDSLQEQAETSLLIVRTYS